MFIRVPEAHTRSIVKAVSWRVVGSLDTFLISWLVTHKLVFAVSISFFETFTKIAIYYGHERFWAWVPWWRPRVDVQPASVPIAQS
ncbi:MAG TPA: DUF2061 domain-containing protein [Caulobacteraceae bacterium]|nr:DUF2061 domain-containing protein [Caulobacteraceae bacterium]